MSLNRCEDAFLAYLHAHPDERRFWTERVLALDRDGGAFESRVATLEGELRAYAAERGAADARLHEDLGAGRVRLRNLAEHVLRLWTSPKPPARNG